LNVKIEICCASVEDVFEAKRGGADRVELNSALFLGGLTPSIGLVRRSREAELPMMVMVRPRDGGFCYTESEFDAMLEDIKAFREEGVEGLVFGVLTPDGRIDVDRCRKLLKASGNAQKVFHRAFDVVPDWREAMDELVELGFDRILTSGQKENSILGKNTIKEMLEYANGRIEILPGGGIRPHNIKELIEFTGCTQAHASAGAKRIDSSCHGNSNVHFGPLPGVPEDEYTVTDAQKVKALVDSVNL